MHSFVHNFSSFSNKIENAHNKFSVANMLSLHYFEFDENVTTCHCGMYSKNVVKKRQLYHCL